ncbi:MAG: hypothetical protein Q4F31_03480 [Eubacteriales bacterium]|nr:hypothetical protein [Eubacteriales bacterium]
MNTEKLKLAIGSFVKNKKTNVAFYDENWSERKERKSYYQEFTKAKLLAMAEEQFSEYISKLWSMLIWGNKQYVVEKVIADNGFDTQFYNQLQLGRETARIDYLLMCMRGFYERVANNPDIHDKVGQAIFLLQSKRNCMA